MTAPESKITAVLVRDLASFADPGTAVDVRSEDADGWLAAQWRQDGRRQMARFLVDDTSDTSPAMVDIDGSQITYGSFLAGSGMADLRAVARNLLNVIPASRTYVPPEARELVSDGSETPKVEAMDLLHRLAVPGASQTTVVFISAEAGVGKTALLREFVRRRADAYLDGSGESLCLYVNAQGRRLAQLDEAIAAELDDVRAKFPYHAASALVRTGALTLVVDGFDELIGSVGSYEEAFSSLATFISDLRGSGCIIAAARSLYYEQEFLTRFNQISESTDSWILAPLRLLEWDDPTRSEFIRRVGRERGLAEDILADLAELITHILGQTDVEEVGYKPFFVERTVDLVFEFGALPDGTTLLDRLVAAYIAREVKEKLKTASGESIVSEEQYRLLLSELAEEMWRQETRELSRVSVREIASIVGELLGYTGDQLSEVVERLPYSAVLAMGSLEGSVTFEHDILYSYFLAEPLADTWAQRDSSYLGRLLRRGRLPEEAASMAGRRARTDNPQELIDALSAAVSASNGDTEQVSRNAGNLAAGLLSGSVVSDLIFRGLVFGDARFRDVRLVNATFEACRFVGTNLSRVRFEGSHALGLTFDRVIVSPGTTWLDIQGAELEDFYGLGVRGDSGDKLIFSPTEIAEILELCGLPSAERPVALRSINADIVELVERLCRAYSKTNLLTEADEHEMGFVVTSPYWGQVRSAGLESRLLTYEVKSSSGHKVFLRRHARPQDIMAGLDPDAKVPDVVRSFWEGLKSTTSAN